MSIKSSSTEASGFIIRKANDCIAITAAHAVDKNISVTITHGKHPTTGSITWNGKNTDGIDIATITPDAPLKLACKDLQPPDLIEESLSQSIGQIWAQNPDGSISTRLVTITERSPKKITLRPLDNTEDIATNGLSGAAVVFSGNIVAVVSANINRNIVADRLDYTLRSTNIGIGRSDQTAPIPFTPFDTSTLGPKFREISQKARIAKRDAESIVTLTIETERKVDEAVSLANEVPIGKSNNGYGRYSTDDGDFYSGQVYENQKFFGGLTYQSYGFGAVTTQTGNNRGDTLKCARIRNIGCNGPTIVRKASGSYWSKFDLEMKEGKVDSPARLITTSGRMCYTRMKTATFESTFGTIASIGTDIQDDGRIFEGELGNGCSWEGYGVLWDKGGKLIRVGRWTNGQTVDD